MYPIISGNELLKIDVAIKDELAEVEVSLDLGITNTKIKLSKNGFYVNKKLVKIGKIRDDKSCYVIIDGKLQKVQFFSDEANVLYKLISTKGKPLLQISGTSMHKKLFVDRIERERLTGKVLDSGTGLGYTSIVVAKTCDEVITIEVDKNVVEIAKLNPYSQELFKNKKIKLIKGDLVEKIKKFKDEELDNIILDAGTPRSSGDFFSLMNYQEVYRVLKKGRKVYHYLPKHHEKRGRDFGEEVIKRMSKVGFKLIERNIEDSYAILKK